MISRIHRSFARLALFVLPSVLLLGCGGGGGGGGGASTASPTQIVVAPSSLAELEELCERKNAHIVGPVEGTDYYIVEVPPGVTAEDFKHDMEDEFEVEDCDGDEHTGAPEGGGSTIPIFLGDDVAAIASQPALVAIGVPTAHARGYDGTGVLVAVIDTGVVTSSPALAGRIAPGGRDFVDGDLDPSDVGNGLDDDGDGLVDEGVGHGTFVASLILAVAPNARILPLRVLDSDAIGTASKLAQAIAYAVAQGADVINISAGLERRLAMNDQAVGNAKASGVFVVASAGNRSLSQIDYPAAVSDAQAVASLDLFGRKALFSSFSSAVDFSAPGVDLIGAHPGGSTGTARWSGTSFSAALVTGCFALLRGNEPASANEDLWDRLEDTAVSVDALNPLHQGKLGRGRIDAGTATAP